MAKLEQIELTVRDHAIHCAGCESRIEKVLGEMPGVVRVKANHRTQRVAVTVDVERTSASALKQGLEAAGYASQ